MTQGGFAFTNANDEYYRKLHKHPNQYIGMRKHAINTTDPQFFDLILRMTKRDPNSRPTIDQIRNHHWMQQDSATPKQLADQYKKIMIDAKMT
jgi:serine/threonine protein kinase